MDVFLFFDAFVDVYSEWLYVLYLGRNGIHMDVTLPRLRYLVMAIELIYFVG